LELDSAVSGDIALQAPTTTSYTDGAWHHIATRRIITAGTSQISIWVDGVNVASRNQPGPIADIQGTAPLYVGAEPLSVYYPTYYLLGSVASVKLWVNKTLADADIQQIAATNEVCASNYVFNVGRTTCIPAPPTVPVSPPPAPPAPTPPTSTCSAAASICSYPSQCCSQVCTPWTVPGTCLK